MESFQHISEWRRWPEATFPLTRLRKTDRRKVQDWANEPGPEEEASEHESVPSQRCNCEPRSSKLGRDRDEKINDADRLADIGLDSLRRLTLAALIEDELGITIDEEDITQTTTVGDLRELVGGGGPAEAPSLVRPGRFGDRCDFSAMRHVKYSFAPSWESGSE